MSVPILVKINCESAHRRIHTLKDWQTQTGFI